MPLRLIHGPPNSGRAGLVRRGLLDALERDPVLVVPNADDVVSFERELCAGGAVLGASVMTFLGLFRTVAVAAGTPPTAELTPAQRLGAVSRAVAESRRRLGPLGDSSRRPGFAEALRGLLDELQSAAIEPSDVQTAAATLEGSAYLADVSTLFTAYAEVCDRLGRIDRHAVAATAIAALRRSADFWRGRPVFLYGFDDLTPEQLALIDALVPAAEVTMAVPHEQGNWALEARVGPLVERLRAIGVAGETRTEPDPANTESPLLFHLERSFGRPDHPRLAPDTTLVMLRSAGERAEAESIGTEVAGLIAGSTPPDEIAVVVRDASRRGPLIASVLDSYGIPVALEAEIPVATTSVGGTLMALLEVELGTGTVEDLLRYLRGLSGVSAGRVDWFERSARRGRLTSANAALRLWRERNGELPAGLAAIREAKARPADLARVVAELASEMASRQGSELEARAAAAIATVMAERAELDGLAPEPRSLARVLGEIPVRVWTGPVEGRVRVADPYRLRAARFDHVFVASLQDGEFPRRDGRSDPFLSERQRESLGLRPRHDTEAEERYLFHACLALPRKQLLLSYRDSDDNGGAEPRSPFLDDLRRLLDPAPPPEDDPVEAALTRGRDLAQVVHRVGEAPSEGALARAIAAHGRDAAPRPLLELAGAAPHNSARLEERLAEARRAEKAAREPGPLSHPAVLEGLATVPAYGGTTLEDFDTCSYRWFASHELAPEPLGPVADPLLQGGVAHKVLERLYRDPPAAGELPRSGSLPEWIARAQALVAQVAEERGIGSSPAERAMRRRIEGLLARFLGEEARRTGQGFRPWLLEARFEDSEAGEMPALEIDGWRLHGAIDRVDRGLDGHALVIDYKLASQVTPLEKLEERAKLQLQLYMLALAELWGAEAVGGLYLPLRGTSDRKPRGAFLEDAADDLSSYGVSKRDALDADSLRALLADARRRGGEIVKRMRAGDIRRDPGPRRGLRGHDVCPSYCEFASICRRDRAPEEAPAEEDEEP